MIKANNSTVTGMDKKSAVWKRSTWFTVVEIEVNSHCNKRCVYCPVSMLPPLTVPKFMPDKIFERVIEELLRIDYQGLISYHFYNEPLIRRDLEQLVKQVACCLPHAYQFLYTNGDFLTEDRYHSLIESGVNHLMISSHDNKYVPSRPHQTVQYPKELVLSNRAGMMPSIATVDKPLQQPCFAPSDNFIVTVTGDLVLCCDDAKRTNLMGNIMNSSIEEIWFSRKYQEMRKHLEAGDRTVLPLCRKCNSSEFFKKGENYQVHIIEE